jgi:alpha-L-fucosidase
MAVRKVTLLATGASITFHQKPDGLHLDLPSRPEGLHAYVYRIDMAEH